MFKTLKNICKYIYIYIKKIYKDLKKKSYKKKKIIEKKNSYYKKK